MNKPSNPKDVLGIRKVPMSTVPANVLAEIAVGMLEGAVKYGRHNYRGVGVRASVYYDAAMRHLIAWWEGEDIDTDPGSARLHHVTKAITSLIVLRDAMMQEMLDDDRPPPSEPFYPVLNALTGLVIDRNADKNPRHYTNERSKCNGEGNEEKDNNETEIVNKDDPAWLDNVLKGIGEAVKKIDKAQSAQDGEKGSDGRRPKGR